MIPVLRQVAIIGIAMLLPACGSRTPVPADGLAEGIGRGQSRSIGTECRYGEFDHRNRPGAAV